MSDARLIFIAIFATLIAIAVIVALLAGWRVVSQRVTVWATGWKTLQQKFPVVDVHGFGEKYEATGAFAHVRGAVQGFVVEPAQEGMLITANFAKDSPILIPWSGIRNISEADIFAGRFSVNRVNINYEKELAFHVPKEALSAIQNNLPAERFQKVASPLDIVLGRDLGKTNMSGSAVTAQAVEDKQVSQIESWWGAVAALMLLQAYSFILLQGLIFIFTRALIVLPVLIPWFLVVALIQAGGLRVMNKYLKIHGWRPAFRFLDSPLETLKFCVAILAAGIYFYLLTEHKPVPADPALYHNVGIFENLLFQLFYLALSFVLSWIWKITPKIEAARLAADGSAEMPPAGWANVISGASAMVIGIGLVVFCYFHRDAFYIAGVFGYGIIAIVLSPALTIDPRSWVVKN